MDAFYHGNAYDNDILTSTFVLIKPTTHILKDKNPMEFEEFKKSVMNKLPEIPEERDYKAMECGCRRLYEDGFTVNQAVRFCLCTEEVSPELKEDIALKRMHDICEEVRKNPVTGRKFISVNDFA